MSRLHNFSAGPAVLPEPVVRRTQEALWELNGSGLGLCECSHRSALFDGVLASAKTRLRALLQLSDDQEVLFLPGGAQTQFYQVPMNLLGGGRASYLDTGVWSAGAMREAKPFGTVDVAYSSGPLHSHVPQASDLGGTPEGTKFLHYTSNNTVAGTQFHYVPDVQEGVWRICDVSSDIVSQPIQGSEFDLLYAGAQKNLGPSGLALVVIRKALLDHCDEQIPTMLRYGVQVAKNSMFNTPNTFAIYVIDQVCQWIEEQGGLEAVGARNRAQAGRIYGVIDGSDFWTGKARLDSRSLMNLTFTTGDADRDTRFHLLAAEQGMAGLKGHRIVGGLRASIYNAQTDAAVDALVEFMREFERTNG